MSYAFDVTTKEQTLEEMLRHQVVVVTGGFFGDEAKGKIITALAGHPAVEVIFRPNGGQNAGHTVYIKGRPHVFHALPSGIATPKKLKLCGPEMVIDPVTLVDDEIQSLIDAGIEYKAELVMDNFFITTPYHKVLDAMRRANVSTLRGIAPSHASKVMKRGLRLDDLFASPAHQREVLERDMELYDALVKHRAIDTGELRERLEAVNERSPGRIPEHVFGFLEAGDPAGYLIDLYQEKVVEPRPFRIGDTRRILRTRLANDKHALLEGSQSTFLSNAEVLHWRSSTSADTSSAGIKAAAGYDQERHLSHTVTVFKVPSSRVGRGANPAGYVDQQFFSRHGWDSMAQLEGRCEDFEGIRKAYFADPEGEYTDHDGTTYRVSQAMAIASAREHGEFGATTGKPRVLGPLDCVLANEALQRAEGSVIISCLDRYDEYERVPLVTGYRLTRDAWSRGRHFDEGTILRPGDELPCENALSHCEAIIEYFDGWEHIGDRHDLDELPENLQHFLSAAMEQMNAPLGSKLDSKLAPHNARLVAIGNGPRTQDLIYVKQRPS